MSAQTSVDWSLITQILGFIGVIIAIVTATHKITKGFTEIKSDIKNLKERDAKLDETIEKQGNKLEEFTILYKTDIAVRQAQEIQRQKLKEMKKGIKGTTEEKKEEEKTQNE